MMLVAGVLLVIAMTINFFGDKEVNKLYLGLGLVLIILSTAVLLFKKK